MIKASIWATLLACLLSFFGSSSAHAGSWAASNPQNCTPDGWGGATYCVPAKIEDWAWFDFSGVIGGNVLPGFYPTSNAYMQAVKSALESGGHCQVSLSTPTGPRDSSFQMGVLVAQTWDFEITMGNSEVPCNPQLVAWPDLRQVRNVVCQAPYALASMGGAPICACPPNGACDISPPPPPCDVCKGNPVQIINVNKREVQVDYQSPLPSGIKFVRTFNSRFQQFADPTNQIGRKLSANWTATYLQRLTYSDSGAAAGAWIYRPDGSTRTFYETATGFSQAPHTVERLSWVLDGSSNKIGFRLVTDDDSVEVYSLTGRLLSITSRAGVVQALAYDTLEDPISVTDSFGNVLQFQWSSGAPPRRLVGITAPGSQQFTYGYDANGNLSSVTYPDTTQRIYHYEYTDSGRLALLTGITDEAAVRYATWQYNEWAGPTLSEHAGGVERYVFDWSSPVERRVIDPLGQARTYGFTISANRYRYSSSSATCPGCGESASVGYDANGNTNSKTDFKGIQTTFGFDLTRNLQTTRTEAIGTPKARTVTTAWHGTFRLPTSITEPNRTTSFTHDANGNVLTRTVTDTSVTPNVARTWTYTYNSFGRVLTENGPRTDVTDLTTFTYYNCATGFQCGQLNTVTNAAGHVTTYNTYNAHGQPTQITDANGLVTSLAYDARLRLTDRCVGGSLPSCSGGELTHLEYWPTGLLKKATNPDGSFIQYTYDGAHRLTQIQDGDGNKIIYTLDNASNRTAENIYDPSLVLKRTHARVFNSLNQLWKDVNAAGTAAVTTTFGYDNEGNQTTTNAPLSRNSVSAYDELNRLNQITDANSGITQFAYDANDNLTSVTDPRSLVTSYTYSGFGDLKTQVSPDTGTTTNTYDSGGNLKTSTDARNAITTYTYDAMNRVTSAAFKIGSTTDQTITYTYDAGTNQKGYLTGASDSRHSMSWTYDAKGRVVSKAQTFTPGTPVTHTVGYGYNASGQLTSLTMPSGNVIQYGYNANGQVTSVTLVGSPNVTILSGITYDPFGPITGWTWGNGSSSTTRTFDTDGKLTQLTSQGQRTFGYDDAFRITAANDVATPANSWTLGYDILDRLNSATKTGTTIGYTYDASGNRLSQTGTTASTYTVSGTSNKLSSTTGALARTYNYNTVGSVLTSGATTHTYYNSGRMKTGQLGSATATTYDYNALGQRMRKGGGAAGTVYFAYDETGHLLGEYNSTGALTQETVWLGDIPVATLRPKTGGVDVFYVHTDQLNTPRKVTNVSNVVRWSWDPTPFGEGTPAEPAGTFKYNLRFPGQYFDVETNLNYNYFRDYDPAVGRYDESDPIGLGGGLNTYGYAKASPVLSFDPMGLLVWRQVGYFRTLVARNYPLYPGGPSVPASPDDSSALTVADWKIKSRCACKKFEEFDVVFYANAYLHPDLIPEGKAWGMRAEGDHMSDILNWAGRKGRQIAKSLEDRLKGKTFASDDECRQATREALSHALAGGGIGPAIQDSIDKWDHSGLHDWTNPNRRQ